MQYRNEDTLLPKEAIEELNYRILELFGSEDPQIPQAFRKYFDFALQSNKDHINRKSVASSVNERE